MKAFAFLFPLLLLGWLAPVLPAQAAEPAKVVYFGVAGFGSGMGIMGHAFVVLANKPRQMLGATAFQYNLKLEREPESVADIPEVLSISSFIASEETALDFIQRYTVENRAVLLYEVNLSEAEAIEFESRLRADKRDRDAHPRADYDVFKNNCLTMPLRMLNEVVTPERRFHAEASPFAKIDLARNVPLVFAEQLGSFPLFKPDPMLFNPAVFKLLRTQVAIDRDLEKLGEACGWSEAKSESIRRLARNPVLLQKESFAEFVVKQRTECDSADAPALIDDLLLLRGLLMPRRAGTVN